MKNEKLKAIRTYEVYLIEPNTTNQKLFSLLHTHDEVIEYSIKPLKFIDYLCKSSGSNYKSAKIFSEESTLDKHYKPPIVVGYYLNYPLIFFPIYSPDADNNCWFAFHGIQDFYQKDNDTEILLTNDKAITLPVDFYAFCVQYARAARLYRKRYGNNNTIFIDV